MTTTAFDDQFVTGKATAQLRKPYDTVAILRRNIADAKKEMQRQAERAESYAETLRSLASYVGAGGYNADTVDAGVFEEKIRWGIGEIMARMERAEAELVKLRSQEAAAWAWDYCGINVRYQKEKPDFLDGSCAYWPLYAAPAPAVPAEWRKVMAELAADLQAACDAEHQHRDQYPSVMRKYNNDMEIVEKARVLLQSAEQNNDAAADRLLEGGE